jgi:integrase/recombinase XerD
MKQVEVISIKIGTKERIGLCFPFDKEIIYIVRRIPGAAWSRELTCWHVGSTQANLNMVHKVLSESGIEMINKFGSGMIRTSGSQGNSMYVLGLLSGENEEKLKKFGEYMKFRRYSSSTQRTYSQILNTFFRFSEHVATGEGLRERVIRFTNEYIIPKKLSNSYQNQFLNALRLFYREIEKSEVELENVERPRREHRLPNVLSKDEVNKILKAVKNLKHRTMLSLIYACGLRRGELLNLKPSCIDSKRNILNIKMAKGMKDRIVPLSDTLIKLLRDYYSEYRPKVWLFEGVKKGEQYDERSLQMVLKKAVSLAGIKKPVTLHWLRHSYATHLHERGVDIYMIQLLLGHKKTSTTEIYTHVSKKSIQNVRSPFDDL